MSEHELSLKRKQAEQESTTQRREETRDSPRSDVPRRAESSGLARLPVLIRQAGNAAVSHLLGHKSGGKPLPPRTQTVMERAFGADFSQVRIHDGPQAQGVTDTFDAQAITHGDDVYLEADAPAPGSPAGEELLAHELAHVVQQRQAHSVDTSRKSEPGDTFESSANTAAQQAVQGQQAELGSGGSPPAIQLQAQPKKAASRAEVERALRIFLERALAAQGGRSLRVTKAVRNAVMMLARANTSQLRGGDDRSGQAVREANIQAFLDGTLPGTPAEFAHQVVRRLPVPFDPEALRRLSRMPVSDEPPTSRLERIKRTAPGDPEREEQREAERLARGETDDKPLRVPKRTLRSPQQPSPEARLEEIDTIGRRVRGEKDPFQVGPISVDLLRLRRILRALPEPRRGPTQRRPQARSYPEIERAVQQQVSPDALVPAEVTRRLQRAERAREFAGPEEEELRRLGLRDARAAAESFADAREVALGLARLLDEAHQQGHSSVRLRLGASYNQVRNRRTIYSELKRIALIVRNRLPHRAAGVRYVDVYFGDRLATRIRLDMTPAEDTRPRSSR